MTQNVTSHKGEGAIETRIILREYDRQKEQYVSSEIKRPEGVAAVKDWIAANADKMPPPSEIGAVMPACELLIAEGGRPDSPTVKRVAVYREVDRSGRIAVPTEEIDRLRGLFRKWGETVQLNEDL